MLPIAVLSYAGKEKAQIPDDVAEVACPNRKTVAKRRPRGRCPCKNAKCTLHLAKEAKAKASRRTLALKRNDDHTKEICTIPNSSEDQLRGQFVSLVEDLHIEDDWCGFAPNRLGRNEVVDSAARAAITAYRCRRGEHGATPERSYRRYIDSMQRLRSSVDTSDETLLTVALLHLFECIAGPQFGGSAAHQNAADGILLARSGGNEPSELATSILYFAFGGPLRFAMVGRSAPFDNERWLNHEPPRRSNKGCNELDALRHLSFKLHMRLPGLIASVRDLRNSERTASVEQILSVAEELMLLEDESAENEMLHRVHLVPTLDPLRKVVIPYSFEFRSLFEHINTLRYWAARLILMNLFVKLITIFPVLEIDQGHKSSFTLGQLQSKQRRPFMNILMSLQYATTAKGHYGVMELRQAYMACWGALLHMDDNSSFRNVSVDFVRSSILESASSLFGDRFKKPWKMDPVNLDTLCEVFLGGPISGTLSLAHPSEPLTDRYDSAVDLNDKPSKCRLLCCNYTKGF